MSQPHPWDLRWVWAFGDREGLCLKPAGYSYGLPPKQCSCERLGMSPRAMADRCPGCPLKLFTLLGIIAALLCSCGDDSSLTPEPRGGTLQSQRTDTRFRYCTYTDGFILTEDILSVCPLSD